MNYGFFRVCCSSPEIKVCATSFNAQKIIENVKIAYKNNASLIVFPELSITGYTAGDLFLQKKLQISALEEVERIADETKNLGIIIVVGAPLATENALYNCAFILQNGKILAAIPKTFIPNYSEFYERRYFSPYSKKCPKTVFISKKNPLVPFGTDIILCDSENSGFNLAVELCEDLWTANPPSVNACFSGATVIANLSASNEIIGKAEYRKNLVKMNSARTISAYIYANASHDESTQDLIFSGHNLICENGTILAEAKPFSDENMIFSDIDVERLCQERKRTTTFSQSADFFKENYSLSDFRKIYTEIPKTDFSKQNFLRKIEKHPFVPESSLALNERSKDVITLQAEGLRKRLKHINCSSAVLGLSGGLDSTLALLVTVKAFDLLKIDRKKITAVTLPCFGTTDRTYKNACELAKYCGVSLLEINIQNAVLQHFKDINHDQNIHDITYENSQARERTQVLMDIANQTNGIVIGTGDLSELALGWCTYNADQMSMYGVNSSIPKTLVRHLVNYFAQNALQNNEKNLCEVLKDILDTPVSPELLPPEDGKISQKTEDLVGPYELHDFYLYYLLRFGFSPKKILFLAEKANLPYDKETKIKWLKNFYKRFFSQQFKRSCMPDGAKVGTVNLSPRGDWRMPSDATSQIWLEEIENL